VLELQQHNIVSGASEQNVNTPAAFFWGNRNEVIALASESYVQDKVLSP
jgi:hypothetical protein